jgi:hypothetical protein
VQLHGIFTDISTDELRGPYPGAARARPDGMHAQRSREAGHAAALTRLVGCARQGC